MDIFQKLRDDLLLLDPVYFVEKYLTLDGEPFRLNGNGFKPFADIYRYIGIKALERDAKPVVMVKGRQVGATTMAAALECYFMACNIFGVNGRSPMRIMHAFPVLEMAYAYSKDKLAPMIANSVPDPKGATNKGKPLSILESLFDTDSPTNNSLAFKKFINGNQIWIDSTGLDGGRLRGRTVDALFFDEIQDIRQKAIANSSKIATASKYGRPGEGLKVFFGTPLLRGSTYHDMWKNSTQQYYHLRCERCHEYFPLYTPGSSDWESIWLYGFTVRCPHCSYEQDKRDAAEGGKWIAFNPDPNTKYVGYHINQLYIPFLDKQYILDQKPENSTTVSETEYQNEVLGEFYSGDGSLLTVEDIDNNAADVDRKFRASIPSSEERRVYLGCDWGAKSAAAVSAGKQTGKSYSCVVVLTVEGPLRFSIDFARRLERSDPEYKKGFIEEMFRKYSVTRAVGDIGFAFDLTQELQKQFNEKFLASEVKAQVNNHVKYVDDEVPKVIRFEKDYYLNELMHLIKNGHIRFPYGSWEQIAWLVRDCTSMETKVSMSRTGEPIVRYVKGNTPNDGLMALLNAYLAYKFDLTDGFKIKNPSVWDKDMTKTNNEVAPITTLYMPDFKAFGG